jgi:hypothetical protein
MKITAIICTRDSKDITKTMDKLLKFYVSCGIQVILMSGAKSLFGAYQTAFQKLNPNDEDIVIFCHDDIEIRETPEIFIQKLSNLLELPETGFVGPAGTAFLGKNAIWWDMDVWSAGKHHGKVLHINPQGHEYVTFYGKPDDVVVLDGLFLAAKAKTVKDVGLQKPSYLEGEWDFYDIYYTSQAFLKGYTNKVLNIEILHNSRGECRESWNKNRENFIKNNELPMKIED